MGKMKASNDTLVYRFSSRYGGVSAHMIPILEGDGHGYYVYIPETFVSVIYADDNAQEIMAVDPEGGPYLSVGDKLYIGEVVSIKLSKDFPPYFIIDIKR